jgi:N6-L-threonylcarbamoyladenine synthase
MDFAFSGLVTKAQQMIRSGNHSLEDIAFSFQEHAFSMVTEAAERAVLLVLYFCLKPQEDHSDHLL